MYKIQYQRFQKLDDILQDDIVAATMALSLLVRRCVKPYGYNQKLIFLKRSS